MSGKQRAIEILDSLPDDVSWEDVLDAFRLDIALTSSFAAADRGELVPHEEVMQKFQPCTPMPSK